MSKIQLNNNIMLQVRIRVLYDVINNLTTAFGFPSSIADILYKGIVKKQILESVYAYYINEEDKAVGKAEFIIDWDKYNLYANTGSGRNIEIDTTSSLLDQFATWAQDLINYIEMMQTTLHVSRIKVFFRYRKEIRTDCSKDKEADDFLGLTKATNNIDFDDHETSEFQRIMNCTSEMLPELEIIISSDTK
jgi:hypothetical protein